MRVLTTWIYFDRSQLKISEIGSRRRYRWPERDEDSDLGVGVAWFAGDASSMMPIWNVKAIRPLSGNGRIKGEPISIEQLRVYLSLFLVDADEYEFLDNPFPNKNSEIVDYLLGQPIVIERSPPITVTLKGLMSSTNLPMVIGTFLGWEVAPDRSVLLFVTVPGGILVVSSAFGLASALGAGLSKSVKRLFKSN